MMLTHVEDVALRLFEARGFGDVTVEEVAAQARISARTFYRYFPAKEDVLQLRIERRTEVLRSLLAGRPATEPPLQSLRLALAEQLSNEDPDLVRRWIAVVAATPGILRAVVGGIQLNSHVAMAEFFASRFGTTPDALGPTMLAAAAGGVVQAAHTHWFFHGGDLAVTVSQGLEILETGMGADLTAWPVAAAARATERETTTG
jgi:AcrR family transcriptional regulator